MAHQWKLFIGQFRIYMIVGGLILLSAGIFLAVRNFVRPQARGQPIPADLSTTSAQTGLAEVQGGEQPVSIRLSAGQPQPQDFQPLPLATGEPLTEAEIAALLARLPDMPAEPTDEVDFKLAQDPIPPPRPGETVAEAFPPPTEALQPELVASGPLEVLRFAPQGEIAVAPFVNITFNQPMVPLATLDDLAAADVPAQIQPVLLGTWRWLGTRTLTFQYDSELIDRLPKATSYTVTVPAGTRSAVGGVLGETVEWTFTTPPPKVTASYPSDTPQPLDPIFFIAFDQRIDPAAVLSTVQVNAGGAPVSLELAPGEAVQADEQVSRLAGNTPEGRWLAFRALEPLPGDTPVSVTIGPGTPSAEGPLVSQEAHSFGFHTYAPLRIVEHGCSWSRETCPPLTPFYIRFNNPIDAKAYTEDLLTIQPELPGAVVDIFGDTLNIRGATAGQTTYTVLVSGAVQDIFGQRLGTVTQLTFRVGPAEPVLFGPDDIFVTLDPAARKPVFSVYTINYSRLDVKIYAVQPSDWPEFTRYLREDQRTDVPPKLPGRLVLDETLRLENPADTLTEVPIDLSEVMDGDYGHFVLVIETPQGLFRNRQYHPKVQAWVQVTQIGLDAFLDHSEMVAWTTALKDGAPLSGVTVQAGPGGQETLTGADGIARFAIPDGATYLVARQAADLALLPRTPYFWDEQAWRSRTVNDELRWYVFDDRQMYRPGEEVHVKGWLRRIGRKQGGDVGLVNGAVSAVRYRIIESQGNELGGGRAEVNALGGFDFAFTLPQEVNLGYAQLILEAEIAQGELDGLQYSHAFQIQEFRRPEFEVLARSETPGPYFAGEHATLAVEAKYYAGGPLPNAEVTWQVASTPSTYEPPNWPDFTFGTWTPWWFYDSFRKRSPVFPGDFGETRFETFTGQTDAAGAHYLRLDFDQLGEPRPTTVLAEATVMDVNRQAWAGTTTLLVHPASLYVGLRSERFFVERGTPLKVDFIVTDLDGNSVPGQPVEVRAARLEWKYRGSDWSEEEVDVQQCSLSSAPEPLTCTFETPLGGRYLIAAVVTDELGRKNQSQFTRWVSGGQQPPARKVEQETVTLIPDQETYQPGEVAHILVQSPFSPAEGLLTVSRNGLLYSERFRIEQDTITLDVPVEEKHIPNLTLQVDLVGAAPRRNDQGEVLPEIPARPAYATGQLNLSIPPLQRTLALQVTPAVAELEPGGETTIDILLKDAAGRPVSDAELAVVVVDEAILALSNYQLVDPASIFYSDHPANWMGHYSRASLVLVDPQALSTAAGAAREVVQTVIVEKEVMEAPAMPAMAAGEDAAQAANAPAPIQVRVDFNPLATFAPAVKTGADGVARVAVKLPDNLTRYRVMVVAVDGGRQFGMAEANLVARLPLMVRPSAPRFLNFGDRFELPVVLQNQTDAPLVVDVALQASNLVLTGSAGLRVTVPARDRVEVRFPAATLRAGTARFQVAAVAGDFTDAATVELPVYTPATTEAFATYGVVDQGAVAQPVAVPNAVFPQYGGLEIQTSSTALQALTDAVLYLVSYPFECTEQLASRILAVAALRDVLAAFDADGLPSPVEMEAAVGRDIERLRGLQNADGGFPYWRRGQDSIPFNTIHVAYALQQAERKGFAVPIDLRQPLLDHLRLIENYYPAWYNQDTRHTLSAYALYVRYQMGDRDSEKALRLLRDAGQEKLGLDAIGWLWPVLLDAPGASVDLEAIRRHVNNRVVETASTANFTTSYDDQNYLLLGSDRRTDAILLQALIADNPQHDLIPKLVNGLLAHRARGRWSNTQENVFVLLALDLYFNTFETQTPDFVARLWLGEDYAGGHEFRGRTTERHETIVPMAYLVEEIQGGGTRDLIISKDGPGRLYYRLGLRYAPTDLELAPLDMGFAVQRSYEAVDNPEDVYRDVEGAWHIKAGARVRVRLTVVADNRRYHVALVDPLPAGLEIVNPALAVSGSAPPDPDSQDDRYRWWWWTWFEHQNLRDERAEAFTSLLWDGVYEYTYIARATTPGRFVVPPSKAEEMYSPEVFGRSSSAVVIVE